MYEGTPTWKALVTFGFWIQPWQLIDYPDDLPPSVGRVESKAFDPAQWKPEYPNPAFDNMRPDDAFWGARIVAAFSDEAIRAANPHFDDFMNQDEVRRQAADAKRMPAGRTPTGT